MNPTAPAPTTGGAPEVLEVERASATPVPPPAAPSRSRRRKEAPKLRDLRTTQAWFLDAVSWPGGLRGGVQAAARRHGVTLADVCTPGPQLAAVDRLEVYHYAYRARLVEALADDYGALRHALGAERFEAFAARVIALHPSRTRDLNGYGRVVVETLRAGAVRVPNRAFLLALAELEWALVEAVHAPPPPRIDAAALRTIPPERWAGLRFTPSPSLRLLASEWPANRYLQAFREDKSPAIPRRSPSATAVYREGFTVWRMDLSPGPHGLLFRLIAGVPLGEALAPLEGSAEAGRVMRWFEAWVAGGVFAAVTEG